MRTYHNPTNKEIREMQQFIPAKIPFTMMQRILQIAATGFLLASSIALWYFWPHLPAHVPTHFGFDGQADAWGSKSKVLLLLLLASGIYLLITVLLFFPKLWNLPYRYTAENVVWAMQQIRSMMIWLNFVITGLFVFFIFYSVLLGFAAAPPDFYPSGGIVIIASSNHGLSQIALIITLLAFILPIYYYWRKLKNTLGSKNNEKEDSKKFP